MRRFTHALCLLPLALLLCGRAARADDAQGLDLARYRGKVVLLDFWASWCGPCKASFPWMQNMQERFGQAGLVVVAVNVDHERAPAERFLQALRPDFTVVFDPQGKLAERFDLHSMPSSFYIDRAGKVRYTHAGFRTEDRPAAENEIARLVAEH